MNGSNRFLTKNTIPYNNENKIVSLSSRQRYAEFEGVETASVGGTADEWSDSLPDVQKEFYVFYRTPRGEYTPDGATPKTTTHPTMTSNVKFMNFYPFEDIATISPRPMLLITSSEAHSHEFSEDAYARAAERTFIQVGDDWTIRGTVFMKNQGSSSHTKNSLTDQELSNLNRIDNSDGWFNLTVAPTTITILSWGR